jgi:hypothetical protein
VLPIGIAAKNRTMGATFPARTTAFRPIESIAGGWFRHLRARYLPHAAPQQPRILVMVHHAAVHPVREIEDIQVWDEVHTASRASDFGHKWRNYLARTAIIQPPCPLPPG